jgi:acetyl esterase/lipase
VKNFTITLLPLFLAFFTIPNYSALNSNYHQTNKKLADPIRELTDLKDIGYAWNLKDWQGKKVDSLMLDIYYPTGATSDKIYPVVVFCHAGGFTGGDKSNVSSLCDQLADYGYVVVAFKYRTGYIKNNPVICTADTTTMFNAIYRSIQDAQACLRYVKQYAYKYNMDTNWLFIGGSSAGATVALNSAYMNDSVANIYYYRERKLLGSPDSSGNTFPNDYKLKGVLGMWGSLISDKVIDTNYRAYPTLLYKGDNDEGLPDSVGYLYGCPNYAPAVYAGVGIYARLVLERTPAVFYELPGGNHSAYDEDFCMQNAACFFRNIMQGTPYAGRYYYYTPSCPQFKGEF